MKIIVELSTDLVLQIAIIQTFQLIADYPEGNLVKSNKRTQYQTILANLFFMKNEKAY